VNRGANTLHRAPGESIGTFAIESAIDILSYHLQLDPIELRMRNEPDKDPVSGLASSSRHLREAYRGSVADEDRRRFALQGLDPASRYRLHFEDRSAPDTQATGKQLMHVGLEIHLAHTLSSELVFIDEIAGHGLQRRNGRSNHWAP